MSERDHQEKWYRDAIASRFFEREGFRRLVALNLRHLRRSVPFAPHMRVLSLGCGLGDYELAIARDVTYILGIDLSPTAVAEARRRAEAAGARNVEFRSGRVDNIGAAEGSFDVVFALGLLHHLQPNVRHSLLRQVVTMLPPNGWFYARDPNARGVLRVLAQRFWRGAAFQSPDEHPLQPHDIAVELQAAGFERVAIDYTDVLAGPLPWILKSESAVLWNIVFAFDRVWLAAPGLRGRASQFAVTARPSRLDD